MMPRIFGALLLAFGLAGFSEQALAQGAELALGGLRQDSSLPVEVSADQLRVDQASGEATFSGNVVISQGELRLSAGSVRVEYALADGKPTSKIARLHAAGGVTLVTAAEAAEAQEAVYAIESSNIVMTGAVLLTQGQNALSGEKLTLDLKAGTGSMEGRVKTVLQPGGGN